MVLQWGLWFYVCFFYQFMVLRSVSGSMWIFYISVVFVVVKSVCGSTVDGSTASLGSCGRLWFVGTTDVELVSCFRRNKPKTLKYLQSLSITYFFNKALLPNICNKTVLTFFFNFANCGGLRYFSVFYVERGLTSDRFEACRCWSHATSLPPADCFNYIVLFCQRLITFKTELDYTVAATASCGGSAAARGLDSGFGMFSAYAREVFDFLGCTGFN